MLGISLEELGFEAEVSQMLCGLIGDLIVGNSCPKKRIPRRAVFIPVFPRGFPQGFFAWCGKAKPVEILVITLWKPVGIKMKP